MENTFEKYIDIIQSFIPENLVNDAYLKSIRKISRSLPILSMGCFECFLGKDQNRVDFNISICGYLNEHKLICDTYGTKKTIGKETIETPSGDIMNFCGHWKNKNFPLAPFIGDLWLVYDIPNPDLVPVVPWYYVRFNKGPLTSIPLVKKEIVLQTLSFLNDSATSKFSDHWRPFFSSIPTSWFVSAIGFQNTRSPGSMRVYLVTETFSEIFKFLTNNNWPGSVSELRSKIEGLNEGCILFGLAVDVDFTLKHKIGIELWVREGEHLAVLADKLINVDLCTNDQKKAMLNWEGDFEMPTMSNLWSSPESAIQEIPDQLVRIRRSTPYIKIVYEPGRNLVTKSYLFFERLIKP